MIQQWYRFGPTTIAVTAGNMQQHARVHERWLPLFQVQPLVAPAGVPLRLRLVDAPPPVVPAAVELFRYGAIQVRQTAGHFHLSCGDSWLDIAVAQMSATGRIAADFADYGLAEQREFFQLLFLLLLRRQGYYVLHANAVLPPQPLPHDPQAGVLLIGDCGAGKTTLTLSLLQAGWRCVGDDLVILDGAQDGTVMAHGLRRGFSCTPETALTFPALQTLLAEGRDLVRSKKFVSAETLYPAQFVPHCTPRLLLFPTIAPDAQSAVTTLTARDALERLLSQPRAGILVDPPTVNGHLQIYGKLVNQAAAGEFRAGQDVLTGPLAVGARLEQFLTRAMKCIYE
ncbi:MAG: hypothetical protein R3C14_17310 [Caldilineaceae bacterium]